MKQPVVSLATLLLLCGIAPLSAQPTAAPSIWNGIFTEAQAHRGEDLYQSRCASCHGKDLIASYPDAPTLTATAFGFGWHRKTIAEQFERIRATMPLGKGGSLSDQDYLDVVAYILQFNGYPSGDKELTPDPELLKQIVITPPQAAQ